MRKIIQSCAILVTAGLLASCQSASTLTPTPGVQPTQPAAPAVRNRAALDGTWLPTNEGNVGKYTATFASGQFTTRLTGGGGVIGAGSYKILSNERISLVWVGEATGTRNKAECSWGANDMSCRSDKGFQFELRKRG